MSSYATSSRDTPLTAQNPCEESFNDSDLAKLSQKLKRVTWVIQIYDGKTISAGTGFAIKLGNSMKVKDGDIVLMTCAHLLYGKGKYIISVRNIDDKGFISDVEIIEMKFNWDLCLLVVKGVAPTYAAEFAEDGAISNGQTLLHVGHSHDLMYSAFVGRAVYPCVNNCLQCNDVGVCCKYVSSSFKTTPEYRIMGHFWNRAIFDRSEKSLMLQFSNNLWPYIPIIQCAGFRSRHGCSGGPIFNTQGYIVGMMLGEFEGYGIASHVTLLKEFVRMNSN